jgi:excinuclease ABC subunit C
VQLFLNGKHSELEAVLTRRMEEAAAAELYEAAARLRDQIVTVHQMQEKQRVATADDEDADVFGFHYEGGMLAVNLFHMRAGKIVDRRDLFWENLPELLEDPLTEELDEISAETEQGAPSMTASSSWVGSSETAVGSTTDDFHPAAFFSSLLKQIYLGNNYVPRSILLPVDFPDRPVLSELLSERTGHRIEILAPQRGEKRSLVDLVCLNAKQSFDQRFRVLKPAMQAIQQSLQDALCLEELPRRIECFDISHIQGAETVASMVVWEDGAMKKSDYRKFQVKTVTGVDDFASMREVVARRYKRLLEEKKPLPSVVLIDGGLGQLHAAYDALESLGLTLQPLASIAKREELLYVHGQGSEPVVLDRRSPVLHLIQMIRDESHRFAVTYHRKRRQMRDRDSELDAIPGVGPRTRQRLLEHFGSVRAISQAQTDALAAVVNSDTAAQIRKHFDQ